MWCDVALQLWPRNKVVASVEGTIISMPEKCKTNLFKCDEYTHCFFLHSRRYSFWISSPIINCKIQKFATSTLYTVPAQKCVAKVTRKRQIWRICFTTISIHLLALLVCAWMSGCHFSPSLFTRFSSMWLISFSKTQDGINRNEIYWCHHDSSNIMIHIWWVSNIQFQMEVRLPHSLYKVQRRLLWKGQQKLEGKCCC